MSSKIGLNLTRKLFQLNFSLPKRNKKLIRFVIIHYTGMKKEKAAIKRLCDPNSKVSCHYFIKNNGDILNLSQIYLKLGMLEFQEWKKFKSLNKYSIGIEINNPGHEFGYKKFSKKQIVSIKKLLKFLIKNITLKKQNILGHSDIAPYRKKDPGEKFPWKKLADKKLCIWHSLDEKKLKKFRNSKLINYDQKIF